jgi:hypothetical protein
MNSKLTSALASRVSRQSAQPVEVVVELSEPIRAIVDQAQDVPSMMAAFSCYAEPLKARIAALGGDVTHEAWINGTLQAKLPLEAVTTLAADESVALLDTPLDLSRE